MKQLRHSLFLLLTLAFIFNIRVTAQNKTEDVVYLKNGSIIHGTVLEIIPNQSIKIQTADNNLFIFKMEEVDKITKSSKEYYRENNSTPPVYKHQKGSGYVNIPEVGYYFGFGDATLSAYGQNVGAHKNDYHAISIRDVNGYRVNSNCIIGLGVGFESYSGDTNYLPTTQYVPVFCEVKFFFNSHTSTNAGFAFDIGYNIGLTKNTSYTNLMGYGSATITDNYKGGVFLNPAFIIQEKLNEKTAIYFSIGYIYQETAISEKASINVSLYGYSYTSNMTQDAKLNSNFLSFRAGVEF